MATQAAGQGVGVTQQKGIGKSSGLGGAASKSYNVASVWEQTAALSEPQLRAVDRISHMCSQRSYPPHVHEATSTDPTLAKKAAQHDDFVGLLEDAVLHNTAQFHKWFSELEAACASETEEKYKRYADLLRGHLTACEHLLAKIDSTAALLDVILVQHKEVSGRSRALYASCEALLAEKERLLEFADALEAKLQFYDEFESVYAQYHSAAASLDVAALLALLQRLDACIAYVAAHPQYADSGAYVGRFRSLQSKALGSVRAKLAAAMKHAVAQVSAAVIEAGGPAPGAPPPGRASPSLAVLGEGAEVSLLYVRFRAAAEPSLKGLLSEVEAHARSGRPEYKRLLAECQLCYCQARLQVMAPFVEQRIAADSAQPLPAFARAGCERLLQVCSMEAQLFSHFFPGSGGDSAELLAPLMDPLTTCLYDALRPDIVQLYDVDVLCELVDVLKHEVLGDQLSRRGSECESLRPTLLRTLADVQSRLIFRCQAHIKEDVAGYQPLPEDVDYPACLEGRDTAEQAAGPEQADSLQVPGPSGRMYPPVRSTLVTLSQLYTAIDSNIFSGLAQEVVSACTMAITQGSRHVARRSGPLDAQLFMIRHLLLLREQIAPFDVDFAAQDIDLDFTHMRDHMRRILAGEVSLFTLSSGNAVVQMFGKSGPRVMHHTLDSKKDLEQQLKSACETFIMAATKVAVEPMLSFITKVTAVRVAAAAAAAAGSGAQPGSRPIREQAFAAPAKVAEMVAKVNESLSGPLPRCIAKLQLYLANPSTHAILFKPVKSNIAEAHGQVAALLEAEYTREEAGGVPLKKPHELAALLDALC